MGQIGMGAGMGAVSGAIQGTAILPGWGTLIGAIVGAALGAATGAIGQAESQKNDIKQRQASDIITTSTTRATPVAIAFGRNRTGGNIMAVGYFFYEGSHVPTSKGTLIYRPCYVIGLCEAGNGGPYSGCGNVRQDGQLPYDLAFQQGILGGHNQPDSDAPTSMFSYYRFQFYFGANNQAVPALVDDHRRGFFQLPHVPWRNTCLLTVFTIAGDLPRLPDINIDMMGPDYTIRRVGTTTEPNPLDVAHEGFYDGHTESFFYTLASSGTRSQPFGMAGTGRQGMAGSYTAPPASVANSIQKAWYLGRHDVLVMQDPLDVSLFHIGWWGIGTNDPGWEAHRPDPGYGIAINRWHLDEVHGILHTFHSLATDGSLGGYILRWNLLTGRIEKTATNVTDSALVGFMYSADMDCYAVFGETGLHFVDTDSGLIFMTTNVLTPTGVLNIFNCGQMIGTISAGAVNYFNPYKSTSYGPYGSSATDSNPGSFGGVWFAHQNTWTGHVTIGKQAPDLNISLINFIPSIIEDIRDLNCNGTSGLGQDPLNDNTVNGNSIKPEPDFQDFTLAADPVAGWIRDWSVRQTTAWYLNSLQGSSSLTAAMWNANVDEPNTDSKRWGAGLPAIYYSLSSFEALHSYCVGGVQMKNPSGTARVAERYKFDYMLTGEANVGTFNSDQVLMACQGWRTQIDGQMHVGVVKPGQWPIWHFNDRNIEMNPGIAVDFIGRSQGVNRVRIQYRDVLTEYRHDFAEADNTWDQQQRNRVQQATIAAEGCGRYGQAYLLATSVLDQTQGGRRQTTHKSSFISWLLTSTDPVEISSLQAGLLRMPAKVTSIKEEAKDELTEFMCLEHRATMDALGGVVDGQYQSYGPGSGSGDGGLSFPSFDSCENAEGQIDGSNAWFNGGASYPPGDYSLTYMGGTYRVDQTWNNIVAGFNVISRAMDGTTTTLAAAPGLAIALPGWPTGQDAANANLDETITFNLATAAAIGLQLPGNALALAGIGVSSDQTPPGPTYQLCPIASLAVPAGTPDPAAIPSSLHVSSYNDTGLVCTQCRLYTGFAWNGIITNDTGKLNYVFTSPNHNHKTIFGTPTPPAHIVVAAIIPGVAPFPQWVTGDPTTMWLLQCVCAWQTELPVSGLPGWILRFYCGDANGTQLSANTGDGPGSLVWEGELVGLNPIGTYAITFNSCAAGPATMAVS